MDVWNIFSIERRSAFLRFRLVDDFDDVLSGEKRSSMVDSEDFGEEDIAQKKEQKNVVVVVVVVKAKKQHVVSTHNQKGKKEIWETKRERKYLYDWRFFCFFFCFIFQTFFDKSLLLLSLQKVFSV